MCVSIYDVIFFMKLLLCVFLLRVVWGQVLTLKSLMNLESIFVYDVRIGSKQTILLMSLRPWL